MNRRNFLKFLSALAVGSHAQIADATTKYGGASCIFDGTGAFIPKQLEVALLSPDGKIISDFENIAFDATGGWPGDGDDIRLFSGFTGVVAGFVLRDGIKETQVWLNEKTCVVSGQELILEVWTSQNENP